MATIIQVAGAATITLGVGLLSLPIALIIGGFFAVLFGLAVERRK